MKKSGLTLDRKAVYTGVFKLIGTHGIPLEIILHKFQSDGILIDWVDYVKDALRDGHKPNTIKSRILSAIGDIYGHIYKNEIEKRLNIILPTWPLES